MSNIVKFKAENIVSSIYFIRGEKVMLDSDLANMYEIETRVLKQQVRRNIDRFPKDFMFELNDNEVNEVVSQNVIPSKSYFGGSNPMVFTEQGVAMLSSVLKSKKAIKVNIAIMRAFVQLRTLMETHKDLAKKIEEMEKKYDKQLYIDNKNFLERFDFSYFNNGIYFLKIITNQKVYYSKINIQ